MFQNIAGLAGNLYDTVTDGREEMKFSVCVNAFVPVHSDKNTVDANIEYQIDAIVLTLSLH